MKNIYFTILGLCLAFATSAQLINDGGSIVVENGAVLFIESSLQNNLAGSIDIQGTGIVEVQGDVTNAVTGSITMSNTAKLVLSGPNASNLTSGGATLTNVELDKTSNNVTLMDQARISTDLNFVGDNNKLILGDNNLVFAPSATITSADANEYIVADGDANTGLVSKEVSVDEVFKFEIGDATNYTPLDADISGSGFSSATVDVNVVPMEQPNVSSLSADNINRYWNVDQSGITGYSNDLTGTYVGGDVDGDAANVKGAHYGSDWTYVAAAGNGSTTVSGTVDENGDFTGTNVFGKIALMAMLDAVFSGGSMNTTLNDLDLVPLTSPYSDGATVAAGFFDIVGNDDIVDWVWIETRNSTTPATVEGGSSAFVKSDGSIVGLDGTSNPLILNAESDGYVVIKHRNHLGVCTGSSVNLDGSAPLQDFTDPAYVSYGVDGLKNNGGTMTMRSGDSNSNGIISYNGGSNDRDAILFSLLFDPTGSLTNVYNSSDVNMNGTVSYNGGSNDRDAILFSLIFDPTNSFTAQLP